MNFWKKAIALIMALGMTLGFAACGGNEDVGSTNNSAGSSNSEVNEPVAEQLGAAEMEAAIQNVYNAENFTITFEKAGIDGQKKFTANGTISRADGKWYEVCTTSPENGAKNTEYSYVAKEGDTYYRWSSIDNEFWDKDAMTELEEGTDPTSAKFFMEDILKICVYEYFEWDATKGVHVFTILYGPRVEVKVVGGKIVEFRCEEAETVWVAGTIAYGNASVGELPEIDE